MSSRFPPARGDPRYNPRDRSPPRSFDRRQSGPYNGLPSSTRGHNEANYRANNAHSHHGPGREPPRGPKAYLGSSRGGGYIPRGRGFIGRGDARERDYRDQRDNSVARRGRDQRDWGRRDRDLSRERRPSPTGRNRSRSPNRPRDFRDNRDFPPRDVETDRSRRASREGYGQPSPAISDTSHSAGPNTRGGFFGRGRNDWEHGQRSRGSFGEEREPYRTRSRSRERPWERKSLEERERDRNPAQTLPNRDENYSRDWDDREREPCRRESFLQRRESMTAASQENSSSSHIVFRPGQQRPSHDARSLAAEPSPRLPSNSVASSNSSVVRDVERADTNAGLADRESLAQRASSPPQAPQVPAFGSIIYQPPKAQKQSTTTLPERDEGPVATTPIVPQPIANIPSGPKSQLPSNLPTGPKADQNQGKRSLPEYPVVENVGTNSKDGMNINRSNTLNLAQEGSNSRGFSGGNELLTETPRDLRPGHDPPQASFIRSPNFASALRTGDNRYGNAPSFSTMGSNRAGGQDYSILASPLRIPTGPRAERNPPSGRPPLSSPARTGVSRGSIVPRGPQRGMNLRWTRPGLHHQVPRGPSMMGSMISWRNYGEEDNAGANESEGDNSENEGISVAHVEPPTSHPLPEIDNAKIQELDKPLQMPQIGQRDDPCQADEDGEEQTEHAKPSNSRELPDDHVKSSDFGEVVMEDEHMDVDEEYLADERKFERNLYALELKRPATPRHHAKLLQLLDEIDALASAAEIQAHGLTFDDANVKEVREQSPFSCKPMVDNDIHDFVYRALPHRQTVRTVTPPLESLPYLSSGPPTPFSELEEFQDSTDFQDLVNAQILEELTSRVQLEDSVEGEIKRQFAQDYKAWRLYIENMEDQKRAQNGVLSVPDTLALAGPLAQTLTHMEGRRATARNLSQFDLDRVLEESKLSANEEELRRQREAQDSGQAEREAKIPQMLRKHELKELSFVDTTNKIVPQKALTVLGYEPKVDDFSPEEHRLFVEAFLVDPKKFGAIARKIPNRSYQECIQHYYLTKQDGQYKERFSSKAKRGRGKGIRGGSGRPKAAPSSLLSNSFGDDPAVVAVTESGRPRRTAAPTFGAGPDGEMMVQAITPARRNVSGTKAEPGGETPPEKLSTKRARATGKEKAVRKPKAQLLAAAPGPSPQKIDGESTRGKSKEPKLEIEQQLEELKTAQLLTDFANPQPGPIPGSQLSNDGWTASQPVVVSASSNTHKPQYTMQESYQPKGGPPTSSYWSVPEVTDFGNLLHVFGTNWQAIADHMKTKTQTMVKNYYHRQVERGESKMEQAALAADEKIKRGDNMGHPPPPTIVPKRRYDTGPQVVPQRQLAPSVESIEVGEDSPGLRPTKPAPLSPPQLAQAPGRFSTMLQQEPITKPSVAQPVQQNTSSSSVRTTPQTLQQRTTQNLQGPRIGFFSNEHSRTLQAQPQQSSAGQQQMRQQEERQAQTFTESSRSLEIKEALQRGARHQDIQSTASKYQQSVPVQQSSLPLAQATQSRQHSQGTQIRIAPSQATNVEIRPQVAPQPQLHSQPQQIQPQNSRHESNHPENIRRLESYGTGRHTAVQSIVASRVPKTFSPPQTATRPSSVPATAATQNPPKRSNIMNILNDESAEPPPRKKKNDTQPSAPTPPPQSPARHMYQQSIQPGQPFSRRELPAEPPPSQQQQHHHHRSSLGPALSQPQAQPRDAPSTNWAEVAQRTYPDRQQTNYQQQLAESPRMQPSFPQQASRAPLQALQRTHAATPSTAFSHSRASSYASLHTQQQQPPQTHQQTQQAPQAPTQATPVLQPSPYAQIHPHQHLQAQHQHIQSSQQLYQSQQLQNLQQQHQQRDSEPISQHQHQLLRQQEAMRAQQQRQDPFRQVQPEHARQQDRQQYQNTLRPQRDVREPNALLEEMARREEVNNITRQNTYTPPLYGHVGGYQQARERPPRGYDERERR